MIFARRGVVVVLVATVLVVGAVPPAVGATDEGTPDANFAARLVSQEAGDVATVTVYLSGTSTATVNVGSFDANYLTQVDVTDGDGDGTVTIKMNTFLAGGWKGTDADAAFVAADSSDSVDATRRTNALSEPLDTGQYPMNVTVGGTVYDVGTLTLTERSTEGLTVGTAAGDTSTSNAITQAAADSTLVKGEYLVVEVAASGLYGYLSASDLATDLHGVSLTVRQANPPANQDATELDVSGATYVPVPDSDRFYLVFDSSQTAVEPGQEYDVTFTVDSSNPFTRATERVTGSFQVVDGGATIETPLDLRPETGQRISGTTTLAPGTELVVRVESTTPSDPFIRRQTVTVGEGGSWTGTFNFSGNDQGTDVEVVVRRNDQDVSDTVTGTLGGDTAASASVTVNDQSTEGSAITVDSVTLPDGGFVVVHDDSLQTGALFDSIRGHSKYLSPGTHQDVRIFLDEPLRENQQVLALVYTDSDGDKLFDYVSSSGQTDTQYLDDGNYVYDVAGVTVPSATTALPTTAIPTTALPTTYPPTTRYPTTTREPTTYPPTTPRTTWPPERTERTTLPMTTTIATTSAANGSDGGPDEGADSTAAIQFESTESPGFAIPTALAALLLSLSLRRRRP